MTSGCTGHRSRRPSRALGSLCVLIGLLSLSPSAFAARLALLIGNDSYVGIQSLENARADAKAMGVALRAAKYDVVEVQLDQDLRAMQAALRAFKARVKPGDQVVVFFSGHGVQIDGSSYLLPTDIRANTPDDVRDGAITLQRVLDDMAERRPAFTLVIVDACRNNPFKGRRSLGSSGLGPTAAANGQMVVYSAGTGQEALDRLNDKDPVRNGLFTRIFVKEMLTPGLPITQVVDRVRERVRDEAAKVRHDQMPALYNQSVGSFFFVPPTPGSNASSGAGAQGDAAADIAMWNAVKESQDVRDVMAYINLYGDRGRFIDAARARAQQLGGAAAGGAGMSSSSAGTARTPGSLFRECPSCPEMVVLPPLAGTDPLRHVAIGKFEVSFDEWQACVEAGGCTAIADDEGWGRGNRPVIHVTWADANAYTTWLSRQTNARYRLPTEAEWQFGAAGGGQGKYPWGVAIDVGLANCNGCGAPEYERRKTAPVGSFRANGHGLFDVVGNVWEWVADCYGPQMKPLSAGADDTASCASRITKGGSYRSDPDTATVQYRREVNAGTRSQQIGFRVLREM